MFEPEHLNSRSQDLTKAYHDAGQFYFGMISAFLEGKSVFNKSNSKPLILPSYRVQDIDTLTDWTRAELMFSALCQEGVEFEGE
jgi:N-acylneuraminate cytidylyltransferase